MVLYHTPNDSDQAKSCRKACISASGIPGEGTSERSTLVLHRQRAGTSTLPRDDAWGRSMQPHPLASVDPIAPLGLFRSKRGAVFRRFSETLLGFPRTKRIGNVGQSSQTVQLQSPREREGPGRRESATWSFRSAAKGLCWVILLRGGTRRRVGDEKLNTGWPRSVAPPDIR